MIPFTPVQVDIPEHDPKRNYCPRCGLEIDEPPAFGIRHSCGWEGSRDELIGPWDDAEYHY